MTRLTNGDKQEPKLGWTLCHYCLEPISPGQRWRVIRFPVNGTMLTHFAHPLCGPPSLAEDPVLAVTPGMAGAMQEAQATAVASLIPEIELVAETNAERWKRQLDQEAAHELLDPPDEAEPEPLERFSGDFVKMDGSHSEIYERPERANREGETQPLPVKNDSPLIHDLVAADLESRKQLGIRRYGAALQANNGRKPLQDAYEELLDLCCYMKQLLVEGEAS